MAWDLARGTEKFAIDAISDDPKVSIYALDVNKNGLIASGGPESIVRLYDSRTASQTVQFVGHTDNIRSVLVSNDGQWVLSGSSDSTVKLWSVTASRLLHTFDMHDDSVWSLFSRSDSLDVFYSADRTGLVCKTDLRGCDSKKVEVDEGICSVVCNEHQGVSKIVATGDYLWTATSNSCIHRWQDIDTGPYVRQLLENTRGADGKENGNSKLANGANEPPLEPTEAIAIEQPALIPVSSSFASGAASDSKANNKSNSTNSSTSSSATSIAVNFLNLEGGPSLNFIKEKYKKRNIRVQTAPSEPGVFIDDEPAKIYVEAWQKNPVETLEGHIGLIKHRLLTDRRRVLTVDTAGEVKMWDLVQCKPLQSFGTGLDIDDLADELNALDNKTASISNWCQVATRTGELYVTLEKGSCFDAEVYADELKELENGDIVFKDDHRINIGRWVIKSLLNNLIVVEVAKDKEARRQKKRMLHDNPSSGSLSTVSTVASTNNSSNYNNSNGSNSNNYNGSKKADDSSSYEAIQKVAAPVVAPAAEEPVAPPTKSKFMGRLRGFGKKKDKAGSSASTTSTTTSSSNNSTGTATGSGGGNAATDSSNTAGTSASQSANGSNVNTVTRPEMSMAELISEWRSHSTINSAAFSPPPLEDAPPMSIPSNVKILVSEQSADAGGTMDLYRGTVGTVSQEFEAFEKVAPEWLARVIFKNELPAKEGTKVGFTLQPENDAMPQLTGGAGNLRLTAYQMLRARKVLIYLVDKLEGESKYSVNDFDLFCQGKLITPEMTLASIRTKIWRSGGDVVLKYSFKK